MFGSPLARILLLFALGGVIFVVFASSSNAPTEQPSAVADRFMQAIRANDAEGLARLLQPSSDPEAQSARARAILAAVGDWARAAPPSAPFVGLGDRVGDRSRETIVVQARAPHGDLTLWLRAYDARYPIGLHVLPRRAWVIHAVYDGDQPVGEIPPYDARAGV